MTVRLVRCSLLVSRLAIGCSDEPSDASCGGVGICRTPPASPDVFMPLCGRDGVTYSNDCEAYSNEV